MRPKVLKHKNYKIIQYFIDAQGGNPGTIIWHTIVAIRVKKTPIMSMFMLIFI